MTEDVRLANAISSRFGYDRFFNLIFRIAERWDIWLARLIEPYEDATEMKSDEKRLDLNFASII